MKRFLFAVMVAAAAVVFADGPEKDPVAPFQDYGAAMASDKAHPMAVEWQNANNAELAKLDDAWADGFLAGGKAAMDALLAEVKPDYATDALKATQIAVLTQRVMATFPKPWWKFWASSEHPARSMWASRLLAFATESKSVDVKLFFLDQLRWCGYPSQASGVLALKGSKELADFAEMVAAELKGR